MDINTRISDHFTYGEMTTTDHRKYIEQNRKEGELYIETGTALCKTLLEPMREHFGAVIVHSGFRCKNLNVAVGGSPTSQHCGFQAADFHVVSTDLTTVFQWIWHKSGLRWGQLILEGYEVPSWIHISLGNPWRKTRNGMVMQMKNGQYQALDMKD